MKKSTGRLCTKGQVYVVLVLFCLQQQQGHVRACVQGYKELTAGWVGEVYLAAAAAANMRRVQLAAAAHARLRSSAAGLVQCPVAGAAGATALPWLNFLLAAAPQPAGMIPKLHTGNCHVKAITMRPASCYTCWHLDVL